MQGILLLFTVALNLHIFYLYLKLQQQMHLLSERLPLQQELMDQAFTEFPKAESPVFLNRVRIYRKNRAAFMVSRLCIKGLKLYD
ncbi:hypothetical protein BJP34_14195 [Moorena producens PAL-8-15-08-1]|uniref:Uncharacterized protein n=1 Tax=Moorena producens PAL-8-15-08-1 TaxID=1458985 RepID=A0A1D8TSB7_9CYAN|nr:hypothetical protein BJP34_14195 [Moorena producens PAL-8-15-08-1]